MNQWIETFRKTKKKLLTFFQNCQNFHEFNVAKNELIGKNSDLNKLFINFSLIDKKTHSAEWNSFKKEVIELFETKVKLFQNKLTDKKNQNFQIDNFKFFKFKNDSMFTPIKILEPQIHNQIGSPHPLMVMSKKLHNFFEKLNFNYFDAPEIELIKNNFDLLNVDVNHPSRSHRDTFYITKNKILRTHATNATTRVLLQFAKNQKPIYAYHIGNVFRNDTENSTHNSQFLQLDVCLIDRHLTLAHLKWFLKKIMIFLFGKNILMRFRMNYFPFTEPSIEMDIGFSIKNISNNKSKTKWIEILGAGVINPQVLKACDIDNKDFSFLAFGIGLDRLTMIQYQIDDIRKIYQNKLTLKK